MRLFGSGVMIATPLYDASGNAIAVPTPVRLGVLQSVDVNFKRDGKPLHGEKQFPVDFGFGKGEITGKAKFAEIKAAIWNGIFFGQTLAAGILALYNDTTAGTAIPSTPYQITPTVPSSGTWTGDLGVTGTDGTAYIRVASAPTTGQYSVSAGVYTFAAADAAKLVLINFTYSATSTTAQKQTIANLEMGYTPTFALDFQTTHNGKKGTWHFFSVVSPDMGLSFKNDDWMVPDFGFSVLADPTTGNIAAWSASE